MALHELIEKATAAQQGLVVDYIGDGAMIVFGLPAPGQDAARRALRAVVQLHDSMSAWLAQLPPVARNRLAPRVSGKPPVMAALRS